MTTHTNCTHPATKAARAACRRGTTGTTAATRGTVSDRVSQPRPEPPPQVFVDGLGVKIEIGDRVMITGWGGAVRLNDVRESGTVTGYGRTRVHVDWDRIADPPASPIHPSHLGVTRRDGRRGFEGNR